MDCQVIKRRGEEKLMKKNRGKILVVFVAVMLILVCIPAGMAFAVSAPAAPMLSQNGGAITTSTLVSIGNIPVGDTAYYTITGGSDGTTPTSICNVLSSERYVRRTAG
jgi:zinc transporter ZupT